jgi:hypothetical protein
LTRVLLKAGIAGCSLGLAAILATGCRTVSAEASTLKPTHLKGLQHVNLIVFVDRSLEGYEGLERDLSARAQRILGDQGISTEGSKVATLSVDVTTYPAKDLVVADAVLVRISVQLSEQVQLVRDLSLKLPGGNGAVTWSRESITVEPKRTLRTAITNEVDSQVGFFAADVKGVK